MDKSGPMMMFWIAGVILFIIAFAFLEEFLIDELNEQMNM